MGKWIETVVAILLGITTLLSAQASWIGSLVLFLLGIIAVMKEMPNKFVVLGIAFAFLVFAFIYMLNIPMPTGFEQMNFFEFKQ